MKTEISVCTSIMLNDHSNPYIIESTTGLSDRLPFSTQFVSGRRSAYSLLYFG